MFSSTRYILAGLAFVALTGSTIFYAVPKIEADVLSRVDSVVSNVDHMVVSVDGRKLTLLGRIRSRAPAQITPAVHELIDSLNQLPAIESVNAKVDLLDRSSRAKGQASTLIRKSS